MNLGKNGKDRDRTAYGLRQPPRPACAPTGAPATHLHCALGPEAARKATPTFSLCGRAVSGSALSKKNKKTIQDEWQPVSSAQLASAQLSSSQYSSILRHNGEADRADHGAAYHEGRRSVVLGRE